MSSRTRHVPFSQGRLAKWLGRFPRLAPRLARWESTVMADTIDAMSPDSPVWICGMARSGSTILLEMLDSLPAFTAHRYSDYPWLWTPYWWNHVHARLPMPSIAKQERAHRDRIAVNRSSPEAFEEVFWMHFFRDRHDPAVNQVLEAAADADEFARFFDQHQRKLLAVRGARRYLAKANYQLPRLALLHRLYPSARFIIPVREPLAQVASLIKQDRLFNALDREDPQVSEHLARIGHFEFGPRKRALNLGDQDETDLITRLFASGEMAEGYARQWVVQYGHAVRRVEESPSLASACLWLSYERLCADPPGELRRLGLHLGLADAEVQRLIEEWAPNLRAPDYYAPDFTSDERALVTQLTARLWQAIDAHASLPATAA